MSINRSEKKFSKNFLELISFFSTNCFVPLAVGGGIKKVGDADLFFKYGADKIILGSNAIKEPKLINEISRKYGNQSITQSLDCKIRKTVVNSIACVPANPTFFFHISRKYSVSLSHEKTTTYITLPAYDWAWTNTNT